MTVSWFASREQSYAETLNENGRIEVFESSAINDFYCLFLRPCRCRELHGSSSGSDVVH